MEKKKRLDDIKSAAISTVVVAVVTCLINWGIFVTYRDMVAYAASKDDLSKIEAQLNRIEKLTTKLCLKQHIQVEE